MPEPSPDFVDDPGVSDDPHQLAPATDNSARPEDGPQDAPQELVPTPVEEYDVPHV